MAYPNSSYRAYPTRMAASDMATGGRRKKVTRRKAPKAATTTDPNSRPRGTLPPRGADFARLSSEAQARLHVNYRKRKRYKRAAIDSLVRKAFGRSHPVDPLDGDFGFTVGGVRSVTDKHLDDLRTMFRCAPGHVIVELAGEAQYSADNDDPWGMARGGPTGPFRIRILQTPMTFEKFMRGQYT